MLGLGLGLGLSSVSGGGGETSPYLDGVVSHACFDCDFAVSDSYGGSGLLKNLIASPADGAAQTDYDWVLETGVSFVGSAGSPSAYALFDGAGYLSINGTRPPLLRDFHKTINGNAGWFAFYGTFVDATQGLISTVEDAGNNGFSLLTRSAADDVRFDQKNGGSINSWDSANPTLTYGEAFWLFAWDYDTSTFGYAINSDALTEETRTALTANTNDSDGSIWIGRWGATQFANTTRGYNFSGGNAYPTNEEVAAIRANLLARRA